MNLTRRLRLPLFFNLSNYYVVTMEKMEPQSNYVFDTQPIQSEIVSDRVSLIKLPEFFSYLNCAGHRRLPALDKSKATGNAHDMGVKWYDKFGCINIPHAHIYLASAS